MPAWRLRVALVAALLAIGASATGAIASHSSPSIPTFVSAGNNGVPTASYTFRTAGDNSYWTSVREDRLTSAAAQWNVYTDWNPTVNLTAAPADCYLSLSCQGVWIDGSSGCASFSGSALAANCTLQTYRTSPFIHYDVDDSDIFFWTTGTGHPTWSYSLVHPGTTDVYDFQGALTHEMGHAIRLIDLGTCASGASIETMCGNVSNGYPDSYRLRTVEQDDKDGANVNY